MRLGLFAILSLVVLLGWDQSCVVNGFSLSQRYSHSSVHSTTVRQPLSARPTWTTRTSFLSATPNNEDEKQQVIEIEKLTPSQIVELIELSFFQACFALSKGNVEPLKLFVAAVLQASQSLGTASTTIQVVNDSPPSIRALQPREVELRATWIQAIYLLLGHLQKENVAVNDGIDDAIKETYSPILDDLVAVHKSGLGLNLKNFVATRRDILLRPESNTNILALEDEEDDPVQFSIVTQTIQVLYNTLVMMEEEEEDAPAEEEDAEPPKKKRKKTKKNTGGGRGFG